MSRRWVWVIIVLTSVLYQMIRFTLFDLTIRVDLIIDAAYWSGAALAYHWASFKVMRG